MAYKDHIQKIELLELELGLRRDLLSLSISERMDNLSRQSPWVLLGAAAMSGMAVGMLSVRVGAARVVPRLFSLGVGAARLWPSVSRWIASSNAVD